jgi:hypothetical protein
MTRSVSIDADREQNGRAPGPPRKEAMSRKVELYDHDDDLCARGCGRGCSRNTHDVGFQDGVNFASRAAERANAALRATVADLRKRIRLMRAIAHEIEIWSGPGDVMDRIRAAADLRRRPLQKGKRR